MAMERAGVTLLGADPTRHLSSAAMRNNVRQNLFVAFTCNAVGVPVAAGALYPAFGVLLSPDIAAVAMALYSVSVVGGALRLRAARGGGDVTVQDAGKGGAAPCVGTSCSAWCLVRSAAAGRTTPRGAAAGSTAAQA